MRIVRLVMLILLVSIKNTAAISEEEYQQSNDFLDELKSELLTIEQDMNLIFEKIKQNQ